MALICKTKLRPMAQNSTFRIDYESLYYEPTDQGQKNFLKTNSKTSFSYNGSSMHYTSKRWRKQFPKGNTELTARWWFFITHVKRWYQSVPIFEIIIPVLAVSFHVRGRPASWKHGSKLCKYTPSKAREDGSWTVFGSKWYQNNSVRRTFMCNCNIALSFNRKQILKKKKTPSTKNNVKEHGK